MTNADVKNFVIITAVVIVVLLVGNYILKFLNIKTMRLNKKGLQFIAEREGFRPNAYQDSVGVWTIGYGNTFYADGSMVKQGDTITRETAERLFRLIVRRYEDCVNKNVSKPLTQNQFNALVSLCYNIGCGAFSDSISHGVLSIINKNPNDKEAVKNAFLAWRYAGGEPILLSRRKLEADLYFKPLI